MLPIHEPHPLPPDDLDAPPKKDLCVETADGSSPTTTGPSTLPPESGYSNKVG